MLSCYPFIFRVNLCAFSMLAMESANLVLAASLTILWGSSHTIWPHNRQLMLQFRIIWGHLLELVRWHCLQKDLLKQVQSTLEDFHWQRRDKCLPVIIILALRDKSSCKCSLLTITCTTYRSRMYKFISIPRDVPNT